MAIGGMYNTDMAAYRAVLNKEMQYAVLQQVSFWSQFMGFIGNEGSTYPKSVNYGSGLTRLLKPTGKPIEVLTNFQHEGGVTMDIPVAFPIGGLPQYGDTQVLGKEEKRKIAYKTCAVNQVRKGVIIQDGRMSKQVLKKDSIQRELMETAQRELIQYNQRWCGFQPYFALLTRYGKNATAATTDDGLGYTMISHPNFYVAGYGRVPITGTTFPEDNLYTSNIATYEASIITGLDSLTDVASDHFSTDVIENAVFYAGKHKLQPIKFPNGEFFAMVIHPAQAHQLMRDEKWLAANTAVNINAESANRLFTGQVIGMYRGVYIYVDWNIPGARTTGYDSDFTAAYSTTGTTAGTQYGNGNFIDTPQDTAPRKLAILFGQSAIACGYASPLGFDDEMWDYGNKKSEASNMIIGFERCDIYDRDGAFSTAGYFKENTSSLVVATYSPSTPSWV